MGDDISLRCTCGTVRGVLRNATSSTVNRLSCHCDDCQTYAHYLNRADDVLDEWGGTEVFQTCPDQVEFTQGWDSVAAVRQAPKGAVRFYTDCCKTPIGNCSGTPKLPFVGLVHSFLAFDGSPDDVVGPSRGHFQCNHAKGDTSKLDAHRKFPLRVMLRFGSRMLWWRLNGRWKTNPFFDADAKPAAPVTQLTKEQRNALREVANV